MLQNTIEVTCCILALTSIAFIFTILYIHFMLQNTIEVICTVVKIASWSVRSYALTIFFSLSEFASGVDRLIAVED